MPTPSFFFYDLETTGVNPREARIMQFAGQRTDMQLKPIGKPVNWLVSLSDEVLPNPDAIMLTGITPQKANADGVSEAEFLRKFTEEVVTPGTIFTGFNSIRFDDEFMRFAHYRNFYDPYEWEWQDGRGRWDLLDVVRMTRALRPDGIKWPVDSNGKAANRLELLTSINKLEHNDAHDALGDVNATIELAKLIKHRQPKLFDFLLEHRTKQQVGELVGNGQAFIYTCGKYPAEFEKTSVVIKVADHPSQAGAALVYDLRHDPSNYLDKSPAQLVELWRYKKDTKELRLPVKTMRFNRCPAVAPLGVLDDPSRQRLQIDLDVIKTHANILTGQMAANLGKNLRAAVELLNQEQQTRLISTEQDVDSQLYDGFFGNQDKLTMSAVRAAEPEDLGQFADSLQDQRLKAMLPLYKARNFPLSLTDEERGAWESFRLHYLTDGGPTSRVAQFGKRLEELAKEAADSPKKRFLVEELQLYAQSIMPDPEN